MPARGPSRAPFLSLSVTILSSMSLNRNTTEGDDCHFGWFFVVGRAGSTGRTDGSGDP